MLEEFSAGYYIGRFYIEIHDGDMPVMDRVLHEEANEQIYATGDGIDRLDAPLLVKVDEGHFPVTAADNVPTDTIAVPNTVLEATRIENPPTLKEVLIAKAERATQLLELFTPYSLSHTDEYGSIS